MAIHQRAFPRGAKLDRFFRFLRRINTAIGAVKRVNGASKVTRANARLSCSREGAPRTKRISFLPAGGEGRADTSRDHPNAPTLFLRGNIRTHRNLLRSELGVKIAFRFRSVTQSGNRFLDRLAVETGEDKQIDLDTADRAIFIQLADLRVHAQLRTTGRTLENGFVSGFRSWRNFVHRETLLFDHPSATNPIVESAFFFIKSRHPVNPRTKYSNRKADKHTCSDRHHHRRRPITTWRIIRDAPDPENHQEKYCLGRHLNDQRVDRAF